MAVEFVPLNDSFRDWTRTREQIRQEGAVGSLCVWQCRCLNRTTPTPNPSPPQVGPARLAHYIAQPGQARAAWGGEHTDRVAPFCVHFTGTCTSCDAGIVLLVRTL
jgi:hypothetical protein